MNLIGRLSKSIILCLVNGILSGTHFYGIKRFLLNKCGFIIQEGARVVGPLFCTAKLSVGKNSFIGREFKAYGNGSVSIGNNCDIAPDVAILTGSHEIADSNRRAGEGKRFKVVIEDGCWIGARSTISGDIIIKRGSVIGCCSVVLKDVESNTLVAGNPAKEKRKLD